MSDKLVVDQDRKLIFYGDQKIRLTSTQFEIISYLSAHPEYVRSREQILVATKGYAASFDCSPRVVDSEIKRIRHILKKRLGKCPWIQTMYCEGYYWVDED